VAVFLEDTPIQIESLRRYLGQSDARGAERQAHALKSAAAYIGGDDLSTAALEMEKSARAGDLDAVATRMAELDHRFLLLKQALLRDCAKGGRKEAMRLLRRSDNRMPGRARVLTLPPGE
jgi:HPt (histidine-containing phosphotransfer) domain-containing protein